MLKGTQIFQFIESGTDLKNSLQLEYFFSALIGDSQQSTEVASCSVFRDEGFAF